MFFPIAQPFNIVSFQLSLPIGSETLCEQN